MKKFVAILMVIMSMLCAHAEDLDTFCSRFDVEILSVIGGVDVVYIECNDIAQHTIVITRSDADPEAAKISIYEKYGSEDETHETLIGREHVRKNDYEIRMYNIIEKLCKMEELRSSMECGKISKETYEELVFKYRFNIYF